MKKLIAISVILALVAGAAFAQTAIRGVLETRFMLISGNNIEDSKAQTWGGVEVGYVQLTGANSENTLGGLVRIRQGIDGAVVNGGYVGRYHRAFIWYRPIPQLEIFLGIDPDGKFSTDALVGWNFFQDGENYISRHDWGFWRGIFPGNWDGFGAAFTLRAVEGLELNLVIPTGNTGWPPMRNDNITRRVDLENMYPLGLRLMGSYAIPDIGRVLFSWVGPGTTFENAPHFGEFGLSFLLTALDGVQIQAGVATHIPKDGSEHNINTGIAAHYTGDGFGVKARAGIILQTNDDVRIVADIMPWFALDAGTVFVNIEVSTSTNDNATLGWELNPFFNMPIPGGNFRIGLRLWSNFSSHENHGIVNTGDANEGKIFFQVSLRFVFVF